MELRTLVSFLCLFTLQFLGAVQIARPLRTIMNSPIFVRTQPALARTFATKSNGDKFEEAFHYASCASSYWRKIAEVQDVRKRILQSFRNQNLTVPVKVLNLLFYSMISTGSRLLMSYYTLPLKYKILRGTFQYNTFTNYSGKKFSVYFKTLRDVIQARKKGHASFNDILYQTFSRPHYNPSDFIGSFTRWRNSLKNLNPNQQNQYFYKDFFSEHKSHSQYEEQSQQNSDSGYKNFFHKPYDYSTRNTTNITLAQIKTTIQTDPKFFFAPYKHINNPTEALSQCMDDIQIKTNADHSEVKNMLKDLLVKNNTILAILHPDKPTGSQELFVVVNNMKDELKQL